MDAVIENLPLYWEGFRTTVALTILSAAIALVLGTILSVAASQFGRDKMTIVASPAIYDLGARLEQLVAESTGKDGKSVIPIDHEALGKPDVYGRDRIFVYLRLLSAPDAAQDASVDELERAGHPVVRMAVDADPAFQIAAAGALQVVRASANPRILVPTLSSGIRWRRGTTTRDDYSGQLLRV